MRTFTESEMRKIIADHQKWLDDSGGCRADLSGADLREHAGLIRVAYLTRAYLTGAYLTRADLTGANLTGAYLTGAYLTGADLTGAYLTGANLTGAYLTGAYLTDAYLTRANLTGANLTGANGISPERVTPLLILQLQVGKLRAYKLVTSNHTGPHYPGPIYKKGAEIEADELDPDVNEQCGAGINLATLDWCLREYCDGMHIMICEFAAKDLVIPTATDGKFRCRKVKVIGEYDVAALLERERTEGE